NWLSENPIWVDQWPLRNKKLQVLNELVNQQLELGHIAPSVSPWNSPVFVIKKASGKWRLLTDLRRINDAMENMGSLQPGMPSLAQLPSGWPLAIIDLQDCFFHIPLRPEDTPKFAFSVPAVNAEAPNRRFEWLVLPQGMKNSPTLCQLYVSTLLAPFRKKYADVIIYHYMDDILICSEQKSQIETTLADLLMLLEKHSMPVATEKIQKTESWKYLGWKISSSTISPQQVKLNKTIHNLNDLQRLLGAINWVRPILGISTDELHPLFETLKGDPDLASPRFLTPEALRSIRLVEHKLNVIPANRKIPNVPPILVVFLGKTQPFGILCQIDSPNKRECLWEWIFLPHQFSKTVITLIEMISKVIFKGRTRCWEISGEEPDTIYLPLSSEHLEQLMIASVDFQIAVSDFAGKIVYHLPNSNILKPIGNLPIQLKFLQSEIPISKAKNIFTDGSGKTKKAQENGCWKRDIHFVEGSPQLVELSAVVRAFHLFEKEPFNLISDSAYVIGVVKRIEHSYLKYISNNLLFSLFQKLLFVIRQRKFPFFATHIRAHTDLPGP
ncbi:POK11 protein, partial [Formicarius rufipectus]|nr:POK11 protein [Formicarius rufipectus]